jgi:hypothetical protein
MNHMALPKLTIVFSGMIAADPYQGGAIWAVMQYVLGLKRLGHEVVFVEPLPTAKIRPADQPLEQSLNSECFRSVVAEFGLEQSACLLVEGTRQTIGLHYEELHQRTRHADLLINVSGMLSDHELIDAIPCRAFLDLDPAFVQLWHATQQADMRFDNHTAFVTIGQAIGSPDCAVPTCGRDWITTVQPLVLEYWPVADAIRYDGLTTVGHWRGYGSIVNNGTHYGQKAHSFRRFIKAPLLTKERCMPALAIHPDETADLTALAENDWQILDPSSVAATPGHYRQFVQQSKAEIGIAKSGYVESRCGWFSDRSICYLASGRPVIAQETGFGAYLPTGAGLLPFGDLAELLAAIEEMNRDYAFHAQSARRIAEKYFDSDVVIARLLQQLCR